MLQTLFYIPLDIAGIPVFGDGILLGLWVVFSLGFMSWLIWRQGLNADTLSNIPIMLIVAAVIVWLLPAICEKQGLPIRGYGMMMLLGVITGTSLTLWRANRVGINADFIYSLAIWMIIPGIAFARAFYVIEYWPTQYWPVYKELGGMAMLGSILNIAKGGLVVYGSFIGGMLGMLAFTRKFHVPALALADLISPGMILGLALGRIGCLMNGCCYGGECHLPWAISFPANSYAYISQVERGQMYGFRLSGNPSTEPILLAVDPNSPADRAGLKAGDQIQKINGLSVSKASDVYACLAETYENNESLKIEVAGRATVVVPAVTVLQHSLPVHPTQIYSTIDALIICLLLLVSEPFLHRDGETFALLVSIYGVTRFLIEILRTDEAAISGTGMSISQNVSLALLILVVGLWMFILRQPKGRALYRKCDGSSTPVTT
jgi:phosphatidylglycerol---prolipoprotein diacylglyceryl transferase